MYNVVAILDSLKKSPTVDIRNKIYYFEIKMF